MGLLQIGNVQLHIVFERVERLVTRHPTDVMDIGVSHDQFAGAASGFVRLRRDRSAE